MKIYLIKNTQIVHKHVKRCLKSLVIREMKTINIIRYNYTPSRMTIIKRLTLLSAGEDREGLDAHTQPGTLQNGTTILEKSLGSFFK